MSDLTKKINLERPIIFFDLETTGTNTKTDQIVEIAACKILPSGEVIKKEKRFCPTIPIEEGAFDAHGISMDDVKDEPKFSAVAKSMLEFFEGCDIGGYNSNEFDVPLLLSEFERYGLTLDISDVAFIDVFKIEKKLHTNKLSDVYKRYTGKDLVNAHAAMADTDATLDIFLGQLEQLDSNMGLTDIDSFTQGDKKRVDLSGRLYEAEDGEWCWGFGKHKDLPLSSNLGYINWVLKSDFPSDTKDKLTEYLTRQ